GAAACATQTRNAVPPGTAQPDRFLYDRGMAALNEKKWITAREFFKQVVETYTQSQVRPDAKLGLADTYLGENTAESLVLAINEYTEFLSFYPTNGRADYAQDKLEAEALPYYERLVKEFEQSEYLEEARKRIAALKQDAQSKAQGKP